MERYRNDWVFKMAFWKALGGPFELITPSEVTADYYSHALKWITNRIRDTFLHCCCCDESKFRAEMEIISHLVKFAEKTSSELKSLGINDEFVSRLNDQVVIWEYLTKNISIDFANKTIDYYSPPPDDQ